MHLYSLTLQRSSAITAAVCGNFSAPKSQEVVVARGKLLELLRPDENGKVQTVHASEVFGIIRSMSAFRLTGGNRDYLVIGSDSGKIAILEFSAEKGQFERVHAETYGKTGCRRVVPGQYVAADPRGRAVMVGGVEKQKLVYILNRDSAARLTISSPLEAHKTNTLCFAIVGADVGFDNPIFATLEVDCEEVENDPETNEVLYEKNVVFYELDLGLNHVVRKWADAVDPTSNHLVAIPGGTDGPGGVLVCSENFVMWKAQGHADRRCALPRRRDLPADHGLLIVASAVHRQKDMFFILVQSEMGDLYKVTLRYEDEAVHEVVVRYLDTIPVATSLCILKSGFLFGATESGNHGYYQVQGLGDDDDAPMCTSAAFEAGSEAVVELEPRPLRNLLQVDEIESLCPLMDAKLLTRDGTPSLVALCGKSARSTLRTLTRGLAVAEMAVSELPGNPNAVWTVKKRRSDAYDAYIVVSFVNATLVLSIGETVEEVTDSGLKSDSPTVHVALVGDDSIVQVYPSGIRHIRTDGRVNEWRPPKGKPITHATANAAQVVIALSGGEVVYFELDAQQALAEIDKKDSGHEISCLEIGAVPPGRLRSRFVALGGWDNTMRVLSLDPDDCMAVLAVLALPSQAERAVLLSIAGAHGKGAESLYLAIGLSNGVMLRARVDARSGQLSDTRTRFLGAKPARLFRIALGGAEAVLGLSSRPWALYSWQQALHTSPLSYQPLESGCSYTSEHCPEGIVAIAGNTLRIVSVDKLGDAFTSEAVPLRYTPRRMAEHGTSGHLIVIEADHNAYNDDEKAQLYEAAQLTPPLPAGTVLPDDDDADEPPLMEASVGVPRGGAGKWASCVRVLEPGTRRTLSLLELPDNEAAVSVATVTLRDRGGEALVFVGTVKDMTLHPRALSAAFIHVYQFANANATLELLHKTQVDDVPYALAAFSGRLLAGVGKSLRLYECGQKKLLRKTELRQALPTMIHSIQVVSATRIIVGDLAESFHFVKYKRADNEFLLFADDVAPRWLTATCALDLNTMAGADKFGNVYVCRLPQEVADDVEEGQLLAAAAGAEQLALNGAPSKAEEVVQFHVGETVTSLQKACLGAGCSEVLLYTTLLGGIGALLPFTSRQDLEFCQALEMHLRQEAPPLCGRDHLFFRSAFFPVKGVVDGDFCQTYLRLSPDEQRQVAEELDRTPAEVAKKLEELASRIL